MRFFCTQGKLEKMVVEILVFFHCLRYLSPDGACVFAIQLHELWGIFAA